MKIRYAPFFLALAFFLVSCSARVTGNLRADGSAKLAVRASLEPRMAALIRSLSAASGAREGGPVLDGPAIGRSMASAPGIASVSFSNVNPATIEGEILISRVDEFLTPPGNEDRYRFIRYRPAGAASPGNLVISLDRRSGPQLIALISPEVADYLSTLMAPAATGELLSKAEYLDLVASIYGKGVADEIASARINAVIDFPRPVSAIRGGSFQDSQARFEVPLVDLLVLETPLSYEVTWH
ncbi:MAG: hypothetical protein LBP74_02885 [Treponema sp.]|nr:hypothetical protein [Treponema sp.]